MTNDGNDFPEAESFWTPLMAKIFDTSLDAVIVIDTEGRIIGWNSQATVLFGWSREDVVGSTLVDTVIWPEDSESHRDGLQRYLATGEAGVLDRRVELTARTKANAEIPVELSATEFNHHGRRYFVGYVRDISERKRHEEALLREALESKVLEQATRMAISVGSHEESMLRCLATICEKTGWPTGRLLVPDDRKAKLLATKVVYAETEADYLIPVDETIHFEDGRTGEILSSLQPIWTEDIDSEGGFEMRPWLAKSGVHSVFGFPVLVRGEVAAVLEFFSKKLLRRDERLVEFARRLGERMGELIEISDVEQERSRIAAIVDSSYDAIIGKDLDGTVVSWNTGAEHTYGYTEDEVIGQPIKLLLPEGCDEEEPEIQAAIQTGTRLEQFETLRRRKSGEVIHVSVTVSPIADEAGKITGSSTIERDIGDKKRYEAELERAKNVAETARQQAESALTIRRDFLANVSHELRTPMNAIMGMLQLALDEEIPSTVADYLQTASDAADSLLALLNDILDFSRMEAGKFNVEYEPFDLREMLADAMKTVSTTAFSKGLELACDVDPQAPEMVIGDEIRLRQILINLIGNAVKFTEQGEIVVSIKTMRRWPNEVRLRFSVRDTGVGISSDDQQRIFDAFAQADSSSTRNHGGVGLGLAICSELLRLMGSKIRLNSEVGKGSEFWFDLSLHRAEGSPARRPSIPLDKLKGLSVLVVDDNETNRRIMDQTLRNWEMAPTLAADAEQALALMRQATKTRMPFALAIVDALMPGIDGLSLAKQIFDDPIIEHPPVMLMVSSSDRQTVVNSDESSHLSSILSKPISQSDLLDAIFRCLNVIPPQETEQTATALGELLRPMRVLLVEDTSANQKVAETLLKKRGHQVTTADNGREAVELVSRNQFDVILMDVQMPIMDGYQATRAIRKLNANEARTVPIIAMTAHAMRGDREKCLRAGMDGYLPKPIDSEDLLRMVESIDDNESDHGKPQVDGTLCSTNDNTAILNVESALKRIRGDRDLLRDLVRMFEDDAPQLLDNIQTAIEQGDFGTLNRTAHSLKGLAANFDAEPTVAVARRLEAIGETNDMANASATLDDLRQRVAELVEALQTLR